MVRKMPIEDKKLRYQIYECGCRPIYQEHIIAKHKVFQHSIYTERGVDIIKQSLVHRPILIHCRDGYEVLIEPTENIEVKYGDSRGFIHVPWRAIDIDGKVISEGTKRGVIEDTIEVLQKRKSKKKISILKIDEIVFYGSPRRIDTMEAIVTYTDYTFEKKIERLFLADALKLQSKIIKYVEEIVKGEENED